MTLRQSIKPKKNWIISFGISLGLIFYLFRKISWEEFSNQYQNLNYVPFLLLPLIFLITIYSRGARWKLLLGNKLQMSAWELTKICIIGFFANFVLPLRAGELIRPWLLRKKYQTPYPEGLATVVVERAVDILALLALFGWSVFHSENLPSWANTAAYVLGAMALSIGLLVVASFIFQKQILFIFKKIVKLVFGKNYHQHPFPQKLEDMFEAFLFGLNGINSIGSLLMVIVWSSFIWIGIGVYYQVCLAIFNVPADFVVGQLTNVIISLAVAAPSAPGFIGTFQLGCVVALHNITGYTKEFALAYSILAHTIQYIFIVVVGLIVMAVEGFKFKQLTEKHSVR